MSLQNKWSSHKANSLVASISIIGVLILMLTTNPTANTVAISVWFTGLGIGLYNLMQIVGPVFSHNWTAVQSLIYGTASLTLVALSTLGQLTVIDVLAVFVISLLAQLTYRVQRSS